MHHLQRFEFFVGLRLSIKLYIIVDFRATILQGNNVNISVALKMMRDLVKKLKYQRADFDNFRVAAITRRNTINELVDNNRILKKFTSYDGTEEPDCPRAQFKLLSGVSDDTAAQIYWKELYVQEFDTIIEDLEAKLSSEQYQLCAEIEELFLNGIIATDEALVKNLITKHYGTGTNKLETPLYQLDNAKLREELIFFKE